MAWKPGETGNPLGQIREKKFLAALMRAVAQDDGQRLRAAAEKILDLAAAGERWAAEMLADRLDGKPTQVLDVNTNVRNATELPDCELQRIAAGGSAGTAEASVGTETPTQLH